MKVFPPTAADLRRALVVDLRGIDAMTASAGATDRSDLGLLLGHAAGRRLGRAWQPRPPAALPAQQRPPSDTVTSRASRSQTAPGDARLEQRVEVTPDLLRLILSRPVGFQYRPGQHVKVGLPGLQRNYSLVSAPHQPELELFVEVFPGGRLSERLRVVQPGATLRIAGRAKGDLQLDEALPNQLMIATVTGVAPYVSILRDYLQRRPARPHRFIILHGASFADELGYADELAGLAARYPDLLTYLPTVSRAGNARNAGWSGARGRVESHLQSALARFALTPRNTAAYACGHPEMVRQVAADLREQGFTTQTEPFD